MGIGDIRYTVLEVVNEVQRKLGLNTSSLGGNKLAIQLVDFINDVCDDLSDFGNWQELVVSANVTASAGVRDYSIVTSANVKNIGDIYFSQRTGPLRHVTIEEMRLLTQVSGVQGMPSQYTIFGTDSNGNPTLRFRPTPGAAQNNGLFSIVYYQRCPQYTTSDASTLIPFPGNVVVQGVYALAILNESAGSPTDKYSNVQNIYLSQRKEALNRFNSDSGWNTSFRPSGGRRRR